MAVLPIWLENLSIVSPPPTIVTCLPSGRLNTGWHCHLDTFVVRLGILTRGQYCAGNLRLSRRLGVVLR